MILTRVPIEGFPDTNATFLYHKVEKIDLFAIRWAHPDSNPKLQRINFDMVREMRLQAMINKPAPSTRSKSQDILRSNEIEKSRNEYAEMERALMRSMRL